MIIGDVEMVEDDTISVKVDYTLEEAMFLNTRLNCLTDMGSWITFEVRADSVDNYTDCELGPIMMYSTIENKEYNLPADWFCDDLINAVLNVADRMFKKRLVKTTPRKCTIGQFRYEGNYFDEIKDDFPEQYRAKNSDLYYGCTKYNS